MSKQGTSRSRAEKTRGAISVVVPVTNDIVPGKFTEHDLNLCIEQENLDEYIYSLVDSLYREMERQIDEKYLNARMIPFTVDLAKNAMLKIIEWNFLSHDSGESNKFENVWIEDEEPPSCMIDSWAQGYFPKRQASFEIAHHPTEVDECIFEEHNKLEESEEELYESPRNIYDLNENESAKYNQINNDQIVEIESKHEKKEKNILLDAEPECMIIDKVNKPKVPFKPYRGKINFNDLNMLTETLSETEQRIELEEYKEAARLLRGTSSRSNTHRQIENIDYEKKVIQKLFGTTVKNYQQMQSGDILLNKNEQLVTMMKIPSEQLMPQRVKANHKALDIGFTKGNLANKENASKKKTVNVEKVFHTQIKQEEFRPPVSQNDKHPLPMSMLDSIDPVPGVIVQEGDRTKQSNVKKLDREKQMEREFLSLRPIKNQTTKAAFMIQDIINVNKVNIKPLSSNSPIPPIANGFKISQ